MWSACYFVCVFVKALICQLLLCVYIPRIHRCGRAPPTACINHKATRSTAQSAAGTFTRRVTGEFFKRGKEMESYERNFLFLLQPLRCTTFQRSILVQRDGWVWMTNIVEIYSLLSGRQCLNSYLKLVVLSHSVTEVNVWWSFRVAGWGRCGRRESAQQRTDTSPSLTARSVNSTELMSLLCLSLGIYQMFSLLPHHPHQANRPPAKLNLLTCQVKHNPEEKRSFDLISRESSLPAFPFLSAFTGKHQFSCFLSPNP